MGTMSIGQSLRGGIMGLRKVILSCWFALACVAPGHAALNWVGNARNSSQNGVIAPSQELWVVVESYPAGGTNSAAIVYTTNNGANWQWVDMERQGKVGSNDRWKKNLGTFAQGTTIRYAIRVIGTDQTLWDNNGGNDYFVTVNQATTAIRWLGNTSTSPDYGS